MIQEMRTDNYFRVGRDKVIFFDSSDRESIQSAWEAATMSSTPRHRPAIFRPTRLSGAWWACDVLGFASCGDEPAPDSVLRPEWVMRAAFRERLWKVGASHVNDKGEPIVTRGGP